jgi:hypothetical protein
LSSIPELLDLLDLILFNEIVLPVTIAIFFYTRKRFNSLEGIGHAMNGLGTIILTYREVPLKSMFKVLNLLGAIFEFSCKENNSFGTPALTTLSSAMIRLITSRWLTETLFSLQENNVSVSHLLVINLIIALLKVVNAGVPKELFSLQENSKMAPRRLRTLNMLLRGTSL